jgi:hypothetical protein
LELQKKAKGRGILLSFWRESLQQFTLFCPPAIIYASAVVTDSSTSRQTTDWALAVSMGDCFLPLHVE